MLKKVIVFLFCFILTLGIYHGKEILAKEVTYYDFVTKIESKEFTKVEINTQQNKIYLFEEGSIIPYVTQLVSFDEIEQTVLKNIDPNSSQEYKISNRKISVFRFVITYLFFSFILNKLLNMSISFKITKFGPVNSDVENKDDENQDDEEKSKLDELIDSLSNNFFTVKKEKDTGVRLSDVIGLERQLEEMNDIVSFLKEPEKYRKMGAELPKGILLYGNPGTGKTLIAKAIAGEAGVPFYYFSASSVQSKYVGESENNVRKIFNVARKNAPSIIFFDELDSIATQRYSRDSNTYSASVLNQLLSCMDGFDSSKGVIVIAATNYKNKLDEAILRRGRFDRQIYIQMPDKNARKKMIQYYIRNKKIEDESIVDRLANATTGYTGSDIKTIVNEATILAVRHGRDIITSSDLYEAYRKITIGVKNSDFEKNLQEKKIVAVHEAGHAITSRLLGKSLLEISIISRGNSGGYNLFEDTDKAYINVEEILNEVKSMLGGRCAEKVVFGHVTSGASSDLKNATNTLIQMHSVYGMGSNQDVGVVLVNNEYLNKCLIETTMETVKKEQEDCFNETLKMLEAHKNILVELADVLCEKETLTEEEINEFFDRVNI